MFSVSSSGGWSAGKRNWGQRAKRAGRVRSSAVRYNSSLGRAEAQALSNHPSVVPIRLFFERST